MKYSKEWLKEEIKKGKEFSYFGFWGQKSELINEKAMSNFYKKEFKAPLAHGKNKGDMVSFTCSEQYFMYLKALIFNDMLVAKKILVNGMDGNYYKSLGRKVGDLENNPKAKPYDDSTWDSVRDKAMYKALYFKFKDPQLKQWLLDTGDSIIVEASPMDKIWGVGLGKTNRQGIYDKSEKWKDVYSWRGDNKLGFLLMEIRDNL